MEKCVGKRGKMPKQLPKTQFFSFGPFWGARVYLQPMVCFPRYGTPTIRPSDPTRCSWCHRDIGKFVLLHFLIPTSNMQLEVFSNSNWGDIGVPGILWMSSFHNTKEIKIQKIGSKVMISRSVLLRFSWVSQYLNCFNFDFDPWIVVRLRIWQSSQWH